MLPRTRPPPAEPACLVWTASGPATMVLPAGTRVVTELPEGGSGLVALTSAEGLLLRFGRRSDGKDAGWQLVLVEGAQAGSAVLQQGSGGTPDHERYVDGEWERFDAWSDNSRPTAVPWLPWLAGWVAFIGRPPVRFASGRRRSLAKR